MWHKFLFEIGTDSLVLEQSDIKKKTPFGATVVQMSTNVWNKKSRLY